MRSRGLPVILFVDADGTDAPIVEEALRTGATQRCTLLLASGIEEAERTLSSGTQADVIFLRITPGEDGRCSLKQVERLRSYKDEEHAPIVIFAECHDHEFIERVYEFPMTCYVQRVDVREQYLEALRNAFDFWCSTAVLPRCNRSWRAAL
jgi:DNA-binding NarL/FixJ family response regulator